MEGQFFSLFWRNFVDKKITKQYTRNKIVKELTIEQELELMKKVEVKVCVCTACVMNGSVEIMESVESLRHLREQMEMCIRDRNHNGRKSKVFGGRFVRSKLVGS